MNLKRVSIPHLENLSEEQYNRVRYADSIEVHLKVDGAGIRFWKDEGKFVMGTSRVNCITDAQQFIDHNPNSARCRAYAELFKTLEESEFVRNLPDNVTVIAEVLYKPLGYSVVEAHVYVKVPYRISNNLTIGVIEILRTDTMMPVDDNERHRIMMQMITEAGLNDILLFGTWLFTTDGDLLTSGSREGFREDLLSLAERDVFWDILGGVNEGIICRAGDIVFKITTDEYRALRKQK